MHFAITHITDPAAFANIVSNMNDIAELIKLKDEIADINDAGGFNRPYVPQYHVVRQRIDFIGQNL